MNNLSRILIQRKWADLPLVIPRHIDFTYLCRLYLAFVTKLQITHFVVRPPLERTPRRYIGGGEGGTLSNLRHFRAMLLPARKLVASRWRYAIVAPPCRSLDST